MALKLKLDGIYIPSFNKLSNYKNLLTIKNFEILGSAHNVVELKKKKTKDAKKFLFPLYLRQKNQIFF